MELKLSFHQRLYAHKIMFHKLVMVSKLAIHSIHPYLEILFMTVIIILLRFLKHTRVISLEIILLILVQVTNIQEMDYT